MSHLINQIAIKVCSMQGLNFAGLFPFMPHLVHFIVPECVHSSNKEHRNISRE